MGQIATTAKVTVSFKEETVYKDGVAIYKRLEPVINITEPVFRSGDMSRVVLEEFIKKNKIKKVQL